MKAGGLPKQVEHASPAEPTAYLSEVFHSWQGEGLYVGHRQLFVRFAGCNLRCRYCDTTSAYEPEKDFTVTAARGNTVRVMNPVAAETLCRLVDRHGEPSDRCRELTLTGGEPLLWWRFLQVFLAGLEREKHRRLLETNGTLPDALVQIIDEVDIIAMDIKVASAAGTKVNAGVWRRFLEVARACEVFVKLVVGKTTTVQEISNIASVIRSVDVQIPVILQPVTEPDGRIAVPAATMEKLADTLSESLATVRVIPQVHRALGIR